jgi:hypothetical protein
MSNSFHSLPVLSSTINLNGAMTAQYARPPLELLLIKAKEQVADYIRNADVIGLDPFRMVIEDELGDLMHAQGDLSFFMPAAPVLGQWFAGQLNTEIKDQYDRRQHEVWKKMLVEGKRFQVAPNLNAAILPFLVEEERFTVTVFIPRKTNKSS